MLTQLAIRNAKPRDKPFKLSDGFGLHLLITKSGTKLWRFRYRYNGVENMLGLGSLPEVSIVEAREMTTAARKMLSLRQDPSQQRKQEKLAQEIVKKNTFGHAAADYIERLKQEGRADRTILKNEWLLQRLAAPLAKRPIREITAAELLDLLKKLERSGKRETAVTLRGALGSVFRFAIASLRTETDPTYALKGSLLKPIVTHRAAITDEVQFGKRQRRAIDILESHFRDRKPFDEIAEEHGITRQAVQKLIKRVGERVTEMNYKAK